MCGIVGIVGRSMVNQQLYDALTVLQHRGQDAAGIMTAEGGELFASKGRGLVRDVFSQKDMDPARQIDRMSLSTAGGDNESACSRSTSTRPMASARTRQLTNASAAAV
jgi:amidophosphoribosyltransferase